MNDIVHDLIELFSGKYKYDEADKRRYFLLLMGDAVSFLNHKHGRSHSMADALAFMDTNYGYHVRSMMKNAIAGHEELLRCN